MITKTLPFNADIRPIINTSLLYLLNLDKKRTFAAV